MADIDGIRKDIFGRAVIVSTGRSKRPGAFIDKKHREKACPFCPGNESKTEKTVLAIPNERNWRVRVFKNKFPVLHARNFKQVADSFFEKYTPSGVHEVLVETRKHDMDYSNMHEDDIKLVIDALKQRYSELMKIEDVNYVTIFKNKGKRAGASIAHPHLQIIAAPLFPDVISVEMEQSESYFKKEKKCGDCDMIREESHAKTRVVTHNRDWIVICPYVSTWPYQTTILPRRHFSEITDMTDEEALNLAKIIKKLFHGYTKIFDDPPYNIMYHNFPSSDFWHFHIHIYPRIVTHAGFEFFGLNVNITTPEDAAKMLKNVLR
ncbi:MAG: galactose-1-phosphate uridylyltransferase [Candidatus Aenigmarchaeota archaeon]|nr:galactose-1-phosphate uridylyltransferase [Candidatus Aenigmarchaeota archaeon]